MAYFVICNYHKNIHMGNQSGNTGDWGRWPQRKQATDSVYTIPDHEYCEKLNDSQAKSRLGWITLHQRLRIGYHLTVTREFPPPMPGYDLSIDTTGVFLCSAKVAAVISWWINPNIRQNNPWLNKYFVVEILTARFNYNSTHHLMGIKSTSPLSALKQSPPAHHSPQPFVW